MERILVSPHVNSFAIEYDPERDMGTVTIDGVRVAVELLRSIFVAPDPSVWLSLKRRGDEVIGTTDHFEGAKR